MLSSFPRAIIHADADAFFAAVEQALRPELCGKPVVTGKERGIIACASYEAKRMGVGRGVPLFQAKKICPGLIILPSDYETYSIYSKRMFDIMRRYTPIVEEYSIDEAFADITGMRRVFRASYEQISEMIRRDIHKELGITVSVGLSVSKSLAKLCSKFRKPDGFTSVRGRDIHIFLRQISLDKVWGFGPNTVSLLNKYGSHTAYDFACRPERWVGKLLNKPGREIWNELRGNSVWKVCVEEKTSYATIMKSKTFTPASSERRFVYAKLIRNMESAFIKARRHGLRAKTIGIALRHNDFRSDGFEAKLSRPTSCAIEAGPTIKRLFDQTFREGSLYRATLVVLGNLEKDTAEQFDLFEDRPRIERIRCITNAVDKANKMYGKHTLSSATSLFLREKPESSRDETPDRRATLAFRGETQRQRLAFPRFGSKSRSSME